MTFGNVVVRGATHEARGLNPTAAQHVYFYAKNRVICDARPRGWLVGDFSRLKDFFAIFGLFFGFLETITTTDSCYQMAVIIYYHHWCLTVIRSSHQFGIL